MKEKIDPELTILLAPFVVIIVIYGVYFLAKMFEG